MKDISCYAINSKKGQRNTLCKACKKEYDKIYREKTKQVRAEKCRAYHLKNKSILNEKRREAYYKNRGYYVKKSTEYRRLMAKNIGFARERFHDRARKYCKKII